MSTIEPWLREILRCPVCHRELVDGTGPGGAPELHCTGTCAGEGQRRAYRVDDGIPVLLAEEARTFAA
ncbi:hypothetical protein FB554_2074 [Barrientosiimonas humi]|uniref:Uncharacterized protein n=1 Tax=Barrientosiimonas humi TaxID=999931 RepID=A0A542XDL2_9MICO|nr:hypothetical protein [Barrientosiimonas humi]TQL33918.1 hypothetical protein FB554_2074 [Barrientosiimonas humi]CAG7573908.1 hypothetical protein BH39T_PBIAJDOK_02550 [Barrientosiimonas humi]